MDSPHRPPCCRTWSPYCELNWVPVADPKTARTLATCITTVATCIMSGTPAKTGFRLQRCCNVTCAGERRHTGVLSGLSFETTVVQCLRPSPRESIRGHNEYILLNVPGPCGGAPPGMKGRHALLSLNQCRPLSGRRQEPTRNVRDRLATLLSVSSPLARQRGCLVHKLGS